MAKELPDGLLQLEKHGLHIPRRKQQEIDENTDIYTKVADLTNRINNNLEHLTTRFKRYAELDEVYRRKILKHFDLLTIESGGGILYAKNALDKSINIIKNLIQQSDELIEGIVLNQFECSNAEVLKTRTDVADKVLKAIGFELIEIRRKSNTTNPINNIKEEIVPKFRIVQQKEITVWDQSILQLSDELERLRVRNPRSKNAKKSKSTQLDKLSKDINMIISNLPNDNNKEDNLETLRHFLNQINKIKSEIHID